MILQSKSCPACGAPVEFAEHTHQTQCPYCQSWLTDGSKSPGGSPRSISAPPSGQPTALADSATESLGSSPTGWLPRFLSPSGRLARRHYWLGMAVVGGILWLRTFFVTLAPEPIEAEPNGFATALMLLALWIFAVVQIKRLRDRGRSGWWAVVWLLPFGFVWAIYELGLLPSKQ